MRGRARWDEQVEVGKRRRAQRGVAGLGRYVHRVDGLAGTVLARRRQALARRVPEVADCALLADQHPRVPAADRRARSRRSPAGRNDVRTDVAERLEPPAALEAAEAAQAATRRVFEEDALDRILGAELEHLIQ